MKRVFVLVALFGMMVALKLQSVDVGLEQPNPLTLASIGFTALFAFTIGEMVHKIGLPRVTGFILTGVILGPSVTNIFSIPVVNEMKVFNTLALGLIATSAGLELDIHAIRGVWKTLTATILLKILLLLVLVGGTFVGIQAGFQPFALSGLQAAIGLGLIFAVLGIGTSPAIAIAVINDTRAKGRLTDLVLSMAVAKDLVVVVCLAIALAVAQPLLTAGSSFSPEAIVLVGEELLASILTGLAVGLLTMAYIRFIHAEMLLFVVAMILIVSQVSTLLHLELLLVFIVAGFLVRNYSSFEHDLLHPLETVALPVFVVFFTTAGAAIDLENTLEVLPVALALFAARALAIWVAARLGATASREGPAIQQFGWLAYLPQAGVTLGLVLLVSQKLPAQAQLITALGMALVALNLLVGPVTMGLAFKRSGEAGRGAAPEGTPEDGLVQDPPNGLSTDSALPRTPPAPGGQEPGRSAARAGASAHSEPPSATASTGGQEPGRSIARAGTSPPGHPDPTPEELPEPGTLAQEIAARVGPEPLAHILVEVADSLEAFLASVRTTLEGELDALDLRCQRSLTHCRSPRERIRAIRRHVARPAETSALEARRRIDGWVERLRVILRAVPYSRTFPLDPALLDRTGEESPGIRWRIAVRRIRLRLSPDGPAGQRMVPVRVIVRMALEPRIIDVLHTSVDAAYRARAAATASFRHLLEGQLSTGETVTEIQERLARDLELMRREASRQIHVGCLAAAEQLAIADSPRLPVEAIRYGTVELAVTQALEALRQRPTRWLPLLDSQRQTLRLKTHLVIFRTRVEVLIENRLKVQLKQAAHVLGEEAGRVGAALAQVERKLETDPPTTAADLTREMERTRAAFSRRSRVKVSQSTARFRHHALPHQLTQALSQLIEEAPERLEVISTWTPLASARSLDEVIVQEVRFHDILRRQVMDSFLPQLLKYHASALDMVFSAPLRLQESTQVAAYAFEIALKGHLDEGETPCVLALHGVQRAQKRLEELQAELEAHSDALLARITLELDGVMTRVAEEAFARSGFEVRRLKSLSGAMRLQRLLQAQWAQPKALIQRRIRGMRDALVAVKEGDNLRSLRIRSGLERLDPSQMRAHIDCHLRPVDALGLPSLYTQLFHLEALDDRRFFSGREALFQQLKAIEARWSEGHRAVVLLLGPTGAGKSSLVNMFQLEVAAARFIRLDETFFSRGDGLTNALAVELGCGANLEAITLALGEKPTAVFVDGLEQWFDPSPAGVEAMVEAQQLMVRTGVQVLWVVAAQWSAFEQLSRLHDWRATFTHHLELAPLTWQQTRALILARHRLSGFTLTHGRRRWRLNLGRWRVSDEEHYFRGLARTARGNPRAALYQHLRSVQVSGSEARCEVLPEAELPFVRQLPEEATVVLAELLRLGAMTAEEVQRLLRVPLHEVVLYVELLKAAGLLESGRVERSVMVPVRLRESLATELCQLQKLSRGAS